MWLTIDLCVAGAAKAQRSRFFFRAMAVTSPFQGTLDAERANGVCRHGLNCCCKMGILGLRLQLQFLGGLP